MKLRRPVPAASQLLLLPLFAVYIASASASINLSQFQQINGFSTKCTEAYDATVPGCSSSDFDPKTNTCSAACAAGLESVTTLLATACKGISASPSTLIGLFFEGKGVAALCPVIQSSTSTPVVVKTTPQTTQQQTTQQQQTTTQQQTTQHQTTTQSVAPASTAKAASSSVSSAKVSSSSATTSSKTLKAGPTGFASSTIVAEPAATTGAAVFGGGAIPFTNSNSKTSDAACLISSRLALLLVAGVVTTVLCVAI